jgi:hypothetical protein
MSESSIPPPAKQESSGFWRHVNPRKLAWPVAIALGAWAVSEYKEKGFFSWLPSWAPDAALVIAFLLLVYWVLNQPDVKRYRRKIYNYSPKMLLAILMFVGAVLGATLGAFGYWTIKRQQQRQDKQTTEGQSAQVASELPTHPIHPDFQKIHKDYESRLGKPKEKPELIRSVYQAWHENAIVIWLQRKSDIYLLTDDHKYTTLLDLGVDDEGEWRIDEINRKKFRTPQGLSPPWGSVAVGWVRKPKDWRKIGWRRSHCLYQVNVNHMQTFEHGVIISGLRLVSKAAKGEGEYHSAIFVFLSDDHEWRMEFSSGAPPICVKPATTEQELKEFNEKWGSK